MNIKKITLAMACIISAYAGVASAATVDNVTTVTGDVTFTAPTSAITAVITPVAGLTAGQHPDSFVVASMDLTSTSGPVVMAIRPTPAVGDIKAGADHDRYIDVTYSGKTNAANKVIITRQGGAASGNSWSNYEDVGGQLWSYSGTTTSPSAVANHSVNFVLEGAQTIAADTYSISYDVGVYHA